MSTRLEDLVVVAPDVWPGAPLEVQPGDLTKWAPSGFGFGAPLVIRPWDDPLEALRRQSYYGFQAPGGDPLTAAPLTEPAGGTVYFDAGTPRELFYAMLRLLGVQTALARYAAFVAEATAPAEDRFLVQLRIASDAAVAGMFRASTAGDAAALLEQRLSVGDALWAFVAEEEGRWGSGMSPELRGTAGGDGDWAKEALSFGFTVENAYYAVYRIWSRAWLVTK